jgi:hypothetical protein
MTFTAPLPIMQMSMYAMQAQLVIKQKTNETINTLKKE